MCQIHKGHVIFQKDVVRQKTKAYTYFTEKTYTYLNKSISILFPK